MDPTATIASLIPAAAAAGVWWMLERRASAVREWPVAPGTVRASAVRESIAPPGSEDRDWFYADVAYDYSVAGSAFSGSRVRIGGAKAHGKRVSAEAVVARYPAGAAVDVRHDPVDPSRSVLEARANSGVWLFVAAVLAAVAIGLNAILPMLGA